MKFKGRIKLSSVSHTPKGAHVPEQLKETYVDLSVSISEHPRLESKEAVKEKGACGAVETVQVH